MYLNDSNRIPEKWEKKLRYIDDITNQETLNDLVLYGNNRFIQIKAISKLKDKEILEGLALNAKDWQVRFEALKYIDNQVIFTDRALNDRRSEVRRLAARHVNDDETLKQIATTDIDKDVCREAFRRIKAYSNYIYVLFYCRHSKICQDAVNGIYDAELLYALALCHHSHHVRREACMKITNQHVLKTVVCLEKCWDIKKIAFEKIDKPEALLDIANYAENPHITHAAIFRIPYEHIFVDYVIDGDVFLEHYFPLLLGIIRRKSNLTRIMCNSNNFALCRYLIRHIDDEDILNECLSCGIDERLIAETENRIGTLKDKI